MVRTVFTRYIILIMMTSLYLQKVLNLCQGGYLSTMKFFIKMVRFTNNSSVRRPEAKAETYEIKDGAFNQLQSLISVCLRQLMASKVGLGDAQTSGFVLRRLYDFLTTQVATTEASSSDSKSNKASRKSMLFRRRISSIAGTWKNGKG